MNPSLVGGQGLNDAQRARVAGGRRSAGGVVRLGHGRRFHRRRLVERVTLGSGGPQQVAAAVAVEGPTRQR